MTEQPTTATVGEIVAADLRRAAIFDRYGIDFCCNGWRTLEDACAAAAADTMEVVRALDALPNAPVAADDNPAQWPIATLIDHIVSTHHAYVRAAMPTIARHVAKLVKVHGGRHPELAHVEARFAAVCGELEQHMRKEERVLFPYVRDLAKDGGCRGGRSPFGSVENPIRMMEREHADAGDALRDIRQLTRGYTTPEDGCRTYDIAMAELLQFEADLHRHVHLENNVLFPAAIRLERQW